MRVIVQPSTLSGVVTAPASKSAMQRACALALLNEATTLIRNPGHSNDDNAAIDMVEKLGATVAQRDDGLLIHSSGVDPFEDVVNCGESGLGIRMFTPIAALSSKPITINGEGSLLNRPMDFFDEILPQLGVAVTSNAGKLPINIQGPLQPKDISIDGSLSSQFLTGLLLGFARSAETPVTITVSDLKSKPYIDLTLKMMKEFGYTVVNENYERFVISPASKLKTNADVVIEVEGDWSGAAFLLVAGAIAGPITVKGLDIFSKQADKAVMRALMMADINLSITEQEISINQCISNASPGKAFHFNAIDCPDLFPPLVALAAYCDGSSVIEGLSRLAHKESDRGITLKAEFEKMGVEIVLQDDMMIVKGNQQLAGAGLHSHHDHRIAMACAVAGLKAKGETIIEAAEAVNKSYPDFFDHLKLLGASISSSS